jgi:hypothetical protein
MYELVEVTEYVGVIYSFAHGYCLCAAMVLPCNTTKIATRRRIIIYKLVFQRRNIYSNGHNAGNTDMDDKYYDPSLLKIFSKESGY